MNLERKFNKTLLVLVMSIACAGLATTDALAKKGGKGNAGSGDGGEPEPVYSAAGDLINEPAAGYIDSTNLSFDSIIFRPSADFTFDLSGFSVSDPGGGACLPFSGTQTGTLVIEPGDAASPDSAELRFGFQGALSDGGRLVQYFLVMNGSMYGGWPPANLTELTFTSWSIAAENKKSQRSDCEGSDDGELVLIEMWLQTP